MTVFNKLFFLWLLICPFGNSFRDRDSYPSIHDVVSFKAPQRTKEVNSGNDMSIDIERLDVHRLKMDDTAFRNQLMGGYGGELLIQLEKHQKKAHETRRVQKYTDANTYLKAYRVQFRSKMADVMLQLIYMARSKIKSFTDQGNVNHDSTEYRIGYIIRRMENFFFRSKRYYAVMLAKQNNGKWDTESTSILNMHHKIVMAHHDFTHLFFVQMALHERMELIFGRPIHSMSEEPESTTR